MGYKGNEQEGEEREQVMGHKGNEHGREKRGRKCKAAELQGRENRERIQQKENSQRKYAEGKNK